jgi:hypothetical protein
MPRRLDPVDVAREELSDAWADVRTDVPRLVGALVHLVGEGLLQVGVRGRGVRWLLGQPLRETCAVGSWAGRVLVVMEANR